MKKSLTLIFLTIFLSACGLQYTPVINQTQLDKINVQTDLTKNTKKCAYGLFSFPPFFGSASVVEAAKEANFSTISAVENEATFYILFNKTCAVVYGK